MSEDQALVDALAGVGGRAGELLAELMLEGELGADAFNRVIATALEGVAEALEALAFSDEAQASSLRAFGATVDRRLAELQGPLAELRGTD